MRTVMRTRLVPVLSLALVGFVTHDAVDPREWRSLRRVRCWRPTFRASRLIANEIAGDVQNTMLGDLVTAILAPTLGGHYIGSSLSAKHYREAHSPKCATR